MKAKDIIALARTELDDLVHPGTDELWSPDELLSYLNDGEQEACRRGGLLVDSDSRQRYTATVTYGVDGNVYKIVINTTIYSYTAVAGNTATIVATNLAALVNASTVVKASSAAGVISIESRFPYGTYTIANTGTTTPANLVLADMTSTITQLVVLTGLFEYSLDPKVVYVRRARLGKGTTWLAKTLSGHIPPVPSDATPSAWAIDENNTLLLNAKPTEDDRLYMSVIRLPKNDMKDEDSPEIPVHYHHGLINWVCYRAFSKRDSEAQNIEMSKDYEARFARVFGLPVSAQAEQAARRSMTTAVPSQPFGG